MKNIMLRKHIAIIASLLTLVCLLLLFLNYRSSQEKLHYQSLYPDFYVQGKSISVQQNGKNIVYLTFDDGPSPLTHKFLAVLEQENIKATFFVTGMSDSINLSKRVALFKEIAKRGHTIALHSYTHDYPKIYNSVDDYLKDSYTLFKLIKQTTGISPAVFRCAGGSLNIYNLKTYRQILVEMDRRGFVAFDWNVDAQDANINRSKEQIQNSVLEEIECCRQRGSAPVVLMHDIEIKKSTLEALPAIIHELKNRGYHFAAISKDTKPVLFVHSKKTILKMHLARLKRIFKFWVAEMSG